MPQRRKGARVLGPYHDRRGWYVIHVDDQGTRTTVTCGSEEEAEAVKRDSESQLTASVPTTIEEAIELYMTWATTGKSRPIRQSSAKLRRQHIGAFFPRDLALVSLTPRRCQALYDELRARPTRFGGPPSAAYHRQCLTEAKMLLGWLAKKGHLGSNPLTEVEPVGEAKRGKPQLTADEFYTLLGHCLAAGEQGDEGAVQIALLMYFGLRRGESLVLLVRHLSTTAWVLEVPPFKCRRTILALDIPNDPQLRAGLRALVAGRFPLEPLFRSRRAETVNERLAALCERAGVPVVCPQSLRGSQSTLAARLGASAQVIAANLAHHPAVNQRHYTAAGALESGGAAKILELKR